MSPRVRLFANVNIGGAGFGGVTSFSDTFTGANDPNGLGNNWIFASRMPQNAGVNTIQRLGNAMQLSNTAAVVFSTGYHIIPRNVYSTLFGLSQFAQATVSADNSAGANQCRAGVACCLVENDGYLWEPLIDTTQCILRRANTPTDTVIAGPFAGGSVGDVFRLEAVMTPTLTTLRCFRNGTLVTTQTDATILQAGVPGFHWAGCSNTIAQSWQNFSCGLISS